MELSNSYKNTNHGGAPSISKFPIYFISKIAMAESWRKEVYRPPYYIHKWWARRLGSVFRAIILYSLLQNKTNHEKIYYKKYDLFKFKEIVVYDPFMGSGVTIGEALKLGCKVIGRDINPVSYFMTKTHLSYYDMDKVLETFNEIENEIRDNIKQYYKTIINNKELDVLYYFWVKTVNCPKCTEKIDLFTSRIFSKNAYPNKHPEIKSLCPKCGEINDGLITDNYSDCVNCKEKYLINESNISRGKVKCPFCYYEFKLINNLKNRDGPLEQRLYAKMVVNENNEKIYYKTTEEDIKLYQKASDELKRIEYLYPKTELADGHNTKQAINYGYKYWYQFYNDRQLLSLSILSNRIKNIEDVSLKYLFTSLFSSILEFNNIFCSFKGEGTGAIRPLFAHHILKPEMMPLEANVWGTSKSSGSFMTLFESRIIRAIEYKNNPFEIKYNNKITEKIYDINKQMNASIANNYMDFIKGNQDVYLSCGSSDETDIESESVDIIVTDPPFFDNVHYSELADFFYTWIKLIIPEEEYFSKESTRSKKEVQDISHELFSTKLEKVFIDLNRVLKKEGMLVFTYHHSDNEGWLSLIKAIYNSNFYIADTFPIKSEMSVAIPKSQSKEPINYDIIFYLKKRDESGYLKDNYSTSMTSIKIITESIIKQFNLKEFCFSRNDIKIILMGELLKSLSRIAKLTIIEELLEEYNSKLDSVIEEIYNNIKK